MAANPLLRNGVGLFPNVPSQAQTTNATLYGVVTDSGGAAVADAVVTATDVATAVVTKNTTDGTGNYSFHNLFQPPIPSQWKRTVLSQP